MNELRKYLVFLRREKSSNLKALTYKLVGLMVLGVLSGALVDFFLNAEDWYFQVLRAFIALVIGVSLFSISYVFSYRDTKEKTFREEYSYNQRINIAIISFFVIMVVYGLFVKPGGVFYTFLSGVVIALAGGLLAFVRPTTDEYVMYAYGLEDERDTTTERLNNEKIKNRHEQQKNKVKNKKKKKK